MEFPCTFTYFDGAKSAKRIVNSKEEFIEIWLRHKCTKPQHDRKEKE